MEERELTHGHLKKTTNKVERSHVRNSRGRTFETRGGHTFESRGRSEVRGSHIYRFFLCVGIEFWTYGRSGGATFRKRRGKCFLLFLNSICDIWEKRPLTYGRKGCVWRGSHISTRGGASKQEDALSTHGRRVVVPRRWRRPRRLREQKKGGGVFLLLVGIPFWTHGRSGGATFSKRRKNMISFALFSLFSN